MNKFHIFLSGIIFFISSCKKKDKNPNDISPTNPSVTENFIYLNTQNSQLPSDTIFSLFPFNNSLFICTSKGLSIYQNGNISNLNTTNSALPSNNINCCYITDTVWWIGTSKGLFKYKPLQQQGIVYNTNNSPLPNDKIRSIAIDKNNKIWIGTFTGGGIASFDGISWNVMTPSNSPLPSNSIARIFVQDTLYWFGTGGGLARYNTISWIIYTPSNSGLKNPWIYDITEGTPSSYLFIATNNGINTYDLITNTWNHYNSANSGLAGNFTRKLYYDKFNHILWIATDGNGLFKWNFQTFVQYKYTGQGSISSNYLTDVCNFMGKLWIATKGNGICILK